MDRLASVVCLAAAVGLVPDRTWSSCAVAADESADASDVAGETAGELLVMVIALFYRFMEICQILKSSDEDRWTIAIGSEPYRNWLQGTDVQGTHRFHQASGKAGRLYWMNDRCRGVRT
jgi:hypothetical protein